MNSWKSTLLSACAPPLRMFIIGAGSESVAAPRHAAQRGARRAACAPAAARRARAAPSTRPATRWRRDGPCSACRPSSIMRVDRRADPASRPASAVAISPLTFATAFVTPLPRYRFLSPSRSSRRFALSGRRAGRHTARPDTPPSSVTSTSTVGFPASPGSRGRARIESSLEPHCRGSGCGNRCSLQLLYGRGLRHPPSGLKALTHVRPNSDGLRAAPIELRFVPQRFFADLAYKRLDRSVVTTTMPLSVTVWRLRSSSRCSRCGAPRGMNTSRSMIARRICACAGRRGRPASGCSAPRRRSCARGRSGTARCRGSRLPRDDAARRDRSSRAPGRSGGRRRRRRTSPAAPAPGAVRSGHSGS